MVGTQENVQRSFDLPELVEHVLAEYQDLSRDRGQSEAAAHLQEHYDSDDVAPELQLLAEVLLKSGRQAEIQDQLNADRELLHHGHLSHEQLIERGKHYETLRHAACEYNHLVRGLIEGHRDQFTREQLTDWMTRASGNHPRWATGEITGPLSEIALHAALMGLPELSGLRYATLDEDLHGYDFVAQWRGGLVTIDAKTGRYAPITERMHGHRHLELYVPREVMDGFRLTRHGLDALRREARVALQQSLRLEHITV